MNRIASIKALDKTTVDAKQQRISTVFLGIPIVRGNGGYPYSHFSLTDFTPPLEPQLVEDMADLLVYLGDFEEVDIIVSEADRGGGPLAHAVAVRTGLPYTLANWYPAGLTGEIEVSASPVFAGNGFIYLNGIRKGQKAVFVDDLLSSGGTAEAILGAIKKGGAETIHALFAGEKVDQGGRSRLQAKYDIPIISLVRFDACGDVTVAVP
jgi:adenine phosphoribosyltransferase